ncbi:MAG: phytanoyl-CoA dioxygenase family protein [Acidimicrobiia bacterium]|nr:phytanoyl-CoA dioxygenase family protein [Acidimicrobiia bacterium]
MGDGLPELDATLLSTDVLAAGIQHRGAVVVRSMLRHRHVDRLRDHLGHEPRPIVVGPRRGHAGPAVDRTAVTTAMNDLFAAYGDAGLPELVTEYLGDRPVAVKSRTLLKRNPRPRPSSPGLGWHQDGAFFGGRCHALNVWTALTPCGLDRSSLGIVPTRVPRVLGHKPGTYNLNADGRRQLKGLLTRHPMEVPVLEPGDALLFDELTLHRTSPPGTNTAPFRDVAITWLFAPDRVPGHTTPIDL